MTGRDDYYNRAKQQGYRARSAYKLQQLDDETGLLGDGRTVIDLGAAPGGWLQVASERVGNRGTVIGVDRQRIDPIEGDDGSAPVTTIRGDITEDATVDEILDAVGVENGTHGAGGPVDTVLSDMSPNISGEYDLDHARSVHLVREAFGVAEQVLAAGGDFCAKVFDGRDLQDLVEDLEPSFEYVREVRPDASRDSSSELYLVGKHFLTAPVAVGDTLTVEIEDEGEEGDGIAKVDGFTLFVGGVEVGDTVEVRIDDVKPNFAFAQPVE